MLPPLPSEGLFGDLDCQGMGARPILSLPLCRRCVTGCEAEHPVRSSLVCVPGAAAPAREEVKKRLEVEPSLPAEAAPGLLLRPSGPGEGLGVGLLWLSGS